MLSHSHLDFLSELLKVHGHVKYTLVKKHTRYSIKVLIVKKVYVSNDSPSPYFFSNQLTSLSLCRKKDAVDIDMFAEYEKITNKIIEEPSTLTVYLYLNDVKACAKVGWIIWIFFTIYDQVFMWI